MPQPPVYSRQYSFTGFSTNYPSDQQPGTQIDAELNAVKVTLDAILSNLLLLQRDDGALKNASVTLATLASDVLSAVVGDSWRVRGAWATGTAYLPNDVVVNGTSTYLCAAAHTSGTFAADLEAVKWVTIFGAATTTVPDGAVTTAKLADNAVTSAKLSNTIALSGNLSGGTLTAGILTPGTHLMGGRNSAGAAISYVGRTTRAQAEVGIWIDGGTSGSVWKLVQASGSDDLELSNTLGGITTATFRSNGTVDWTNGIRATGSVTPTSGAGIELTYSASTGFVSAYDRSSSAWRALKLQGSTVTLTAGGVDVLSVTSDGSVSVLSANAGTVGYLGIPQNSKTAAYTLVASDIGKHISITTGGVVVPANTAVAFPIGASIAIYNDSASSQTISINTDTLRLAGSALTGARTLAQRGLATLVKVKATEWVVSGAVT